MEDATKGFLNSLGDAVNRYTIKIEPEFSDPPMMEMVRFMGDMANAELQEKILRHCIVKKTVSILLDGIDVGSFQMNNIADMWEGFKPIMDHPVAFNLLLNLSQAFVVKKYSLPPKKEAEQVGAKKEK